MKLTSSDVYSVVDETTLGINRVDEIGPHIFWNPPDWVFGGAKPQ